MSSQPLIAAEREILNLIEARFAAAASAQVWYRSEPLSGFAGRTARQLVQAGRGAEVVEFVQAVDAGVHA
jgi:hypothetical protein